MAKMTIDGDDNENKDYDWLSSFNFYYDQSQLNQV